VIYETHCFGTHDPISLDSFVDTDEINNGEITIIPQYNEYKIINNCFFTEEIYMSLLNNICCYGIQHNNTFPKHPIYRTKFTTNDVQHIVNQLLIKLEKDKDLVDTELKAKSFSFVKEIIYQEHLKVVKELAEVNNKKNNFPDSFFEEDYNIYNKHVYDQIKILKEAFISLTDLKKVLDKLIKYLEEQEPSLEELLEKPEFKIFINKTLEATKRAITKEYEELDLEIIKANTKNDQTKLKKLQEQKRKNHLNESREQIFKFFHLFDNNKMKTVESKTLDKLAIIGQHPFYLGINLGTESNKIILFCRFNDDIKIPANYSFLDMPLFNYKEYNYKLHNKLNDVLYEIIKKNPLDMSPKLPIISMIKQIELKITDDPSEANEIYNRYIETLDIIINSSVTIPNIEGGRKKRIIKSKPKTKRRNKKTI
jgi:hypothetical protein